MATYTFDKPWPKGIIKRDVRISVGGVPRNTAQVSPPDMMVDVGNFAEGEGVDLEFISYGKNGRANKATEHKHYVIPPPPDVPDDVSGTLVVDDQPVPEGTAPADQGGSGAGMAETGGAGGPAPQAAGGEAPVPASGPEAPPENAAPSPVPAEEPAPAAPAPEA
jgi:hypothetical protein